MITRFTISGHIPSKKNSRVIGTRNGRQINLPSKPYREWHEQHLAELRAAGFGRLLPPYKITMLFWAGNRQPNDLTNKAESINDLLKDAGIFDDDDWWRLRRVLIEFGGLDRNNGRVEIVIESADEFKQDAMDQKQQPLTQDELATAALIAEGRTQSEAAILLATHRRTIDDRLTSARWKLGAKNTPHLIYLLASQQLI